MRSNAASMKVASAGDTGETSPPLCVSCLRAFSPALTIVKSAAAALRLIASGIPTKGGQGNGQSTCCC